MSFEFALDGPPAPPRRARAPRRRTAAAPSSPPSMAQQLCFATSAGPADVPAATEKAPEAPTPAPLAPLKATVLPAHPDAAPGGIVRESRRWCAEGWTARIVKIEGDEAWGVEMCQEGEPEPALIAPWRTEGDLRHPLPLDQSSFDALLKTATEILQRQARQLHTRLHQRLSVATPEGRRNLRLDIVPDEYEPYALLTAFDECGEELAQERVRADFQLTGAAARAWMEGDFRRPGQEEG